MALAIWSRMASGANGLSGDGNPPSTSAQSIVLVTAVGTVPVALVSGPGPATLFVFAATQNVPPFQIGSIALELGLSVTLPVPAPPQPQPGPPPPAYPNPPLLPAQPPSYLFPMGQAAQLFSNPVGSLGVATDPANPPRGLPWGTSVCQPFQPPWSPAPATGENVPAGEVIVWFCVQPDAGAPAGTYTFQVG